MVCDHTRLRVLSAMADLGYTRNMHAAALRRNGGRRKIAARISVKAELVKNAPGHTVETELLSALLRDLVELVNKWKKLAGVD
jgi:DNA-binding LacI/PurR family transcriptional regulator